MSPPHILVFTGSGGVGKTTLAAATALRCADLSSTGRTGARTLLLSTDGRPSVDDAFGVEVAADPTTIADGLWAARVGADASTPSDLGPLVRSGGWHTVVVDGRPDVLVDEPGASIRLVVTPESRVLAEARRHAIDLSLDLRAPDVVVVNRLLPGSVADEWFVRRRDAERRHLEEVGAAFAPGPVLRVDLAPGDPVGLDALRRLGVECYGESDPVTTGNGRPSLRITRGEGGYDLALALPFVQREDLELARQGDELVISVGARTRRLDLPDSLRRRAIASARLDEGCLLVHFADLG